METPASLVETLFNKAGSYSKTTIELFKLNAIDKSADVVASLLSRLAILMVVALFILIVNIGIALWLGELLGKSYFGFFIVGGFYALLAILLHAFRHEWIKYPISNTIISQMLKQKTV
ncbi:MAG: hypothetical protein JJE25_15575 [Bacteroidia bacterium]|nr:hypothetical protein [Bacteroidia bacterium]